MDQSKNLPNTSSQQQPRSNIVAHSFPIPATLTFHEIVPGFGPDGSSPSFIEVFNFRNAMSGMLQRSKISATINGFINSERGGIVMLGVDDKGIVQGLKINTDNLMKWVKTMLSREIEKQRPPKDGDSDGLMDWPHLYQLYFVPVVTKDKHPTKSYVIVIVLNPSKTGAILAVKKGGKVYVREEATRKIKGPLNLAQVAKLAEKRRTAYLEESAKRVTFRESKPSVGSATTTATVIVASPEAVPETFESDDAEEDKVKSGCCGRRKKNKNKKNKKPVAEEDADALEDITLNKPEPRASTSADGDGSFKARFPSTSSN